MGRIKTHPRGFRFRYFEAADIMGALLLCPHCNQMLKIVEVGTRLRATAPDGWPDLVFPVKLEDGQWARFWTDRKGILVDRDGNDIKENTQN